MHHAPARSGPGACSTFREPGLLLRWPQFSRHPAYGLALLSLISSFSTRSTMPTCRLSFPTISTCYLIWSALTMARLVRFWRKADVWAPDFAGLGRCLRQRHL